MSQEPVYPPTAPKPSLFLILGIIFLDMVGLGIAIPVTPLLVAGFENGDISRAALHVGTIGTLYTVMMFLFAPLLGALSDRFGRKPVLLAALLVSTASYAWTAFAASLPALIAARALGGLGGASITVANTYMADVTSHEDRAKNFGMVGAAFGLGFIIGPAIGGLLGGLGLRVPFMVAGAVTLLNLLFGLFFIRESLAVEHRRAFSWKEANPLGWIVVLRRHRAVLGFAAMLCFAWFGQQCLQNTWILYTTHRFAWSTTDNGLSLAVVGITTALVQGWLIGRLVPRIGERAAVVGGLLWSAMTLAAYGLVTQGWLMYLVIVVGSIGGVAFPTVQGMVSKLVGPSEQGAVQGTLTSLMSVCGIFSPIVANWLFSWFTGPTAPFALPGVAFFLGGACLLVSALLATRLVKAPAGA